MRISGFQSSLLLKFTSDIRIPVHSAPISGRTGCEAALLSLGEGGGMPYMGYIGMCRYEGYGFQAVYSRIGYINQSFGSRIGYHFSGN